jgi:hypothetical protein
VDNNSNRTRYVVDQYIDPVYSDDSINVNAVCSSRFRYSQHGIEVEVDFHNGWVFDSGKRRLASAPERAALQTDRLVRQLKRVSNWPGQDGIDRTAFGGIAQRVFEDDGREVIVHQNVAVVRV